MTGPVLTTLILIDEQILTPILQILYIHVGCPLTLIVGLVM